MKRFLQSISIATFGTVLPVFVFAQQGSAELSTSGIKSLLVNVNTIISYAIPVLISLGVLAFMWGIVMYLFGTESGKEKGRMFMLWGIIALFVMTSVWGLVGILRGTLFGSNPDSGRSVQLAPLPGNN